MAVNSEDDWPDCSFAGVRMQYHREFAALSFREKLESLEDMNEVAELFLDQRRKEGLPYLDPHTKMVVPGTRAAEQPGEYRA